jgi:hypothetical protein
MSESIYNLIPQPEHVVQKPAMYRSKHDPTLPVESGFTQKKVTMRRLNTKKPDPASFLTKGAAEIVRSSSAPSAARRPVEEKRPAVPARTEKPILGLKSQKDFVVSNAVENILAGA